MDYYKINKSKLSAGSVLSSLIKEYCSENPLLLSDYIDNQLVKYRKYIKSKDDGTELFDYSQIKSHGEVYYQILLQLPDGNYRLHSFSINKCSLRLITSLREIL